MRFPQSGVENGEVPIRRLVLAELLALEPKEEAGHRPSKTLVVSG